MDPSVTAPEGPSPASLALETVARKRLGHPDTICDALAKDLSISLSRFYMERFGAILHHNVDKALLCGGSARAAFGGDDGQVGRGNRANGLITPYRLMSIEAAAGKNPVTHVGKLYTVLTRFEQSLR